MNAVTLARYFRSPAPWTAGGQAVDNLTDPWKHTDGIWSSVDQTSTHPQVLHRPKSPSHLGQHPVVPTFHNPDDEGGLEISHPLLHHLCGQTQGVSP